MSPSNPQPALDPAGNGAETTVRRIYGVLRSRLNSLSVQNIRNTAAAAGIDVSQIPATSEARSGLGSRAEVMPVLDRLFDQMSLPDKLRTTQILADELHRQDPEDETGLIDLLGKHGYSFQGRRFVATEVLDPRELPFLPEPANADLGRAVARLSAGDFTGAVAAACGAVDSTMQAIYRKHKLGDPGKTSFQAKVNTASKQLGVYQKVESTLETVGVAPADAKEIADNLRQATNHAAQALQVLRRAVGDAHGAKPATQSIAYDSVKWASAICGLFQEYM